MNEYPTESFILNNVLLSMENDIITIPMDIHVLNNNNDDLIKDNRKFGKDSIDIKESFNDSYSYVSSLPTETGYEAFTRQFKPLKNDPL
mmetsp:Transcript_35645/g.44030  ORF Transcript_35645/g.44030 Transcript_35645/m.44030 type:complete len:89 (-) Transcript_35645:6-272(-)